MRLVVGLRVSDTLDKPDLGAGLDWGRSVSVGPEAGWAGLTGLASRRVAGWAGPEPLRHVRQVWPPFSGKSIF